MFTNLEGTLAKNTDYQLSLQTSSSVNQGAEEAFNNICEILDCEPMTDEIVQEVRKLSQYLVGDHKKFAVIRRKLAKVRATMKYETSIAVVQDYLIENKLIEFINLGLLGREWVVNRLPRHQSGLLIIQAKAEISRLNDLLDQANQLEDSCLIELILFDLGLTDYSTEVIDMWVKLRGEPVETLGDLDRQLKDSYKILVERQNIKTMITEQVAESKKILQPVQ
ncbi:hypothetical protein E3U55_14270 [Filobacillus milosensis]|uniref:Uncharacterized protein n=1 Tax=Filobacillus milosensis TaxID=94137 RepID=A0A4Y8IGQ5_9BACI|nr:hypothetical protein [Filobacillus milosensis]TFB14211.1 hypothetical protein E3U55_14270 [Filobacillus milosensis]